MNIPSRRYLAGVVTVGALLLTGGCSMFSATQVLEPAQLSDGVSTSIGDVQAQGLLMVGDQGQPGVLTGALINSGPRPVTVTVTAQGSPSGSQVQVPAGSLVTLGSSGTGTGVGSHPSASVVVPTLQAAAGALTPVQLSTPAAGQVVVRVPVLPTSYPYLTTVTPPAGSGGAPTTVPGVTSSPSGTDTQQPTTSPS